MSSVQRPFPAPHVAAISVAAEITRLERETQKTTRRSRFPEKRPPGCFSPDADAEAIRAFHQASGYCVMEDAFTPEEVEALKAETTLICRGGRGSIDDAEPLLRRDGRSGCVDWATREKLPYSDEAAPGHDADGDHA
ncbi:MAG: hypothetical protein ACREIA_02875 [Opitutaceae bacterium]